MSRKRAGAASNRRGPRTPSFVSIGDIDDRGNTIERPLDHDASVSARLSGGDVDARWDQAESSGEETVGGSVSTPDQDIVDEIGEAVGVTYEEGEPLRVGRKEQERDEHRWELNPASAEDFSERASSEKAGSEPILKMKHHDQYKRSS